MGRYIVDSTFRVLRNKGILGQRELYIRNQHCIWSLSCTEEKLLGRCSLDRGQTWTEWIELVAEYNGFFSFTVSEIEKLHFTCKNNTGHLVYVCWHGVEATTNILDSKRVEGERITYHSVLVDVSGTVHIIYFTDSPGEEVWRAYHCLKLDGQWFQPEVFDTGTGKGQNHVAVTLDNEGTIHLVYQNNSRSKSQFVYRSRNGNTGLWSNSMPITDSGRSNLYPCLVSDESNILHLAWIRSDGMNYRVMYRRKTRGGWMVGGWQKEHFLSSPEVNAYTPAVGVWENRVIVFWQQIEGIYQCTSLDNGNTFNEPALKEHYYDLTTTNQLALDFYNKQGLSTMATFDTGSTTVALLANVFQNNIETGENKTILYEKQDLPALDLTPPDLVSPNLDYGQNGLSEYMCRVDQNFRRLFFEMEDSRLNNAQVRETIVEQNGQTEDLAAELTNMMGEIRSIERVVKSLAAKISQANLKIIELEKGKKLLDNKLRNVKEESAELRQKFKQKGTAISQIKEKESNIKLRLDQQATTIMELKQEMKLFKQELEAKRNTPF